MNSLSRLSSLDMKTLWHGNHYENDNRIALRAGALSMIYENGNLRTISDGRKELIRMIYSAVRDKDWLTINPVITDEEFEIKHDSFRIKYHCRYTSGGINFSAWYTIEGGSDNSFNFSFEGEALETFEKSRIGFCVLHPVENCSGKPCTISHSDGNSEILTFPVYISPDQPFTDIKGMKWDVGESVCRLNFSGDVFETEDQRNWTDASYKTYCTPQNLPCPATMRKGDKAGQRIEFKAILEDNVEKVDSDIIEIALNPLCSFEVPLLGIGRSTRPVPLTQNEIQILSELHFDHYRTDLYLFSSIWKDEAALASREAAGLKYSLELSLFFDTNYQREIEDFIGWVTVQKPRISVITLFHKSEAVTPALLLDVIVPPLKKVLPDVIIVCGTNANFAQINGMAPESPSADFLTYSIHPQEHASDNFTLIENLQGQSDTVESAIQFSHGKAIWISPVNIQRRFNANIENYETPQPGNQFPSQADSRIMSLFGACWIAGSVKSLSEAGVKGVTYLETAGERGIIQGDFDSRWPEQFKTVKGMVFPVYHLFKWLLKEKSFRLIQVISTRHQEVDCLALSNGSLIKLAIVNFTSENQNVMIPGFSDEINTKVLNSESYTDAATDFKWIETNWQKVSLCGEQLVLKPYSVNFIEGFLIDQGFERSLME
jgi:D-apionolactonase